MNKQQLISEINQSLNGFIERFAKIDPATINQSRGDGRWTAGELGQHVMLATQGGMAANTKPADRPYDKWVPEIKSTFLDFEATYPSPPFLIPEHTSYKKEDLLNGLKKNLSDQIRAAEKDDLTQLHLDIELPGWGHLTGYEWMKLMIYHVQRHTEQLKNF